MGDRAEHKRAGEPFCDCLAGPLGAAPADVSGTKCCASSHKRPKLSDSRAGYEAAGQLPRSGFEPTLARDDIGSLACNDIEGPNSPLADFTALSLCPSREAAELAMAGKERAKGRPDDAERVGTGGRIRKVEYIRLIEQALYALGYVSAAEELQRESKVPLETGQVASLRASVLAGAWDDSLRILRSLADVTPEALRHAEFLLQQQKFLELLESGDTCQALVQLRMHTTPLCTDRKRLHQLASWLMCTSQEDLLARSGWPGKGRASRLQLMQELQALLPPTLMIPDRRLEHMLEQNLERQDQDCTYHNYAFDSLSLFSDHNCGRDQIPCVTTQVLQEHSDEVWYVQFSHDGTRLASASKDAKAVIWEVHDEFSSRVQHVLAGHTRALSFVAWSPDDRMLVTCGSDRLVKLWDTTSGACLHTYGKHFAPVTACAWFPCGRRFVSVAQVESSSHAQGQGQGERAIFCWDVEGNEVPNWLHLDGAWPQHLHRRITDVAISHDGRLMVTICSGPKMVIHDLETGAVRTVNVASSVTSLSMSLDSHFALVNVSNGGGSIQLWDLEAVCEQEQGEEIKKQPAHQYQGQVQGRYVIRSCFGGSHQSFIISGSEDSQVYIWHRPTGELLHILPGHAGTVNAVSWPASRPLMFASASDDRTVRLWGIPAAHQHRGRKADLGCLKSKAQSLANGVSH